MKYKDYFKWIQKNKILSIIIFIGIVVIGFFSFVFFTSFDVFSSSGTMQIASEKLSVPKSLGGRYFATNTLTQSTTEQSSYEYQIREGSVNIETNDVDSDYQKLKQNAEGYGGWVETISKYQDYKNIRLTVTLKIPSDNFDEYADWLIRNFDVKNSNLRMYKVSVERQQDEIDILTKTLNAYDALFDKAASMELSTDSIELMQQLTDKKLYIMRQMRNYGYSVKETQRKSEYATLSVTLTQKKEIELLPEDLGRELMTKLRDAIRNITNALLNLVTVPIVIFINLIVWIIYAFVVIIPLFLVYKFAKKFFKWLNKKIK